MCHGRGWEMRTNFWYQNLKVRERSDDLGVDGDDNIEVDVKELRWEGVNWIHLVQDITCDGLLWTR
jgi:hypothetical protein